jgi:hypothetical protein
MKMPHIMKLGVVGFYKTTPPIVGANREVLIDSDKGIYKSYSQISWGNTVSK